MAFKKSKSVKKAAPVLVDSRQAEDKDLVIARQAAGLEKAWRERDALGDKLEASAHREQALKSENAYLRAKLDKLQRELDELRAANGRSGSVP